MAICDKHNYREGRDFLYCQYCGDIKPFQEDQTVKQNDIHEDLGDYKSEISFEQALDELHDAAHEHAARPTRESKRRLDEAEKKLYKAKVDFAGENVRNLRDGRKGIDANPAKWKKYWNTITHGKAHKKSAIVKALKKAHAKITNPMAFAKALEERFG